MTLVRESDITPYKTFVENARWEHDRVLFVTVHVVGSYNGFLLQDPAALAEAGERMQANVAWIRRTTVGEVPPAGSTRGFYRLKVTLSP